MSFFTNASWIARGLYAWLIVVVVTTSVLAIEADWIGGPSGTWSEPTNWSSGVAPNTAATNVSIDLDPLLDSTVVLDQAATIGNLSIRAGDTLGIDANLQLTAASATIAGDLTLTTKSKLQVSGLTWVQPSGEIVLSHDPPIANRNISTLGALWNQGVIRGAGMLGGPSPTSGPALTNEGTIVANAPGQTLQVRMLSSLFTDIGIQNFNSGDLVAEVGGTLLLEMGDAYNVNNVLINTGGLIEARGDSTVILKDIGIMGGRLSTTSAGGVNEGVIQFADTTLDGVLLEGNFFGGIVLRGSNVNNGLITADSFYNSVYVEGLTSLHGVGRLALTGGKIASLSQAGLPGDSKLINEKEHTIGGVGEISANFQNLGLLEAHPQEGIASEILTVPGLSVNSGLVRARDGATLQIGALATLSRPQPVLSNFEVGASGVIEAGIDSKVVLGNTTIQGGILRALVPAVSELGSPGTFETSTSPDIAPMLKDVRLEGTIGDSESVWKVTGEIENTGKLEAKTLVVQQQAIFTGGGEIRLNEGQISKLGSEITNSWINEDNIIGGSGEIQTNQTGINRGTIQADVDQAVLNVGYYYDYPTINSGLLQATNGGVLITESVVNYEGTEQGTIHAADNSRVEPRRVEGGVLTTAGSGRIVFRNGGIGFEGMARLTNVHNQGTVQLSTGTLFLGNFRNDGTVLYDVGGASFGGAIFRLSGNGTWVQNLNYPMSFSIDTLFVHEVEHTIAGRMNFQVTTGAFINRGTLIAEESSVITLNQGTRLTQEGIVRVPDSQFLEIQSADQRLTNKGTLEVGGYLLATRTNPGPLEFINAGGGEIHLDGQFGLATQKDALSPILMWNQPGAIIAGQGTINLIEDDSLHTALLLNSGTIRPEGEQDSYGRIFTNGDFQQDAAGRLELDLGGPLSSGLYDALHLQQADALLDGTLQISLVDDYVPEVGHSFEIVTADTGIVSGSFSTFTAPALAGRWWQLNYLADKVVLSVAEISADFDGNGFVDGDDLDDWQLAFHSATGLADADGDGDSDGRDFLAWQRQFGSGINPLATSTAVPEPGTIVCLLPLIGLLLRREAGRGFQLRFGIGACLITFAVISLLISNDVFAVNADWIGGPAGTWSEPMNWSSGVVPNDSATDVLIDFDDATDSAVVLNQAASVGYLTIAEGDSLNIEGNYGLAANSVEIAGRLALKTSSILQVDELTWIRPGGELVMTYDQAPNSLGLRFGLLWNEGVVQAAGIINGISLVNEGTFAANLPEQLLYARLNGGVSVLGYQNINTGEMRAEAGGTLHLVGALLFNAGGLIESRGDSKVILENTIRGGQLLTSTQGGTIEGVMEFRNAVLEDVKLDGNFQGALTLQGSNVNNGTIKPTNMRIGRTTSMEGNGRIEFNGGTLYGPLIFGVERVFVNGPEHTIAGSARFLTNDFELINRGLIEALPQTVTGVQGLRIEALTYPITNSGILRARDGATIEFSNLYTHGTFIVRNYEGDQDGLIEVGVGSSLLFNRPMTVEGGTLRSVAPAPGDPREAGKIQSTTADVTLKDIRLEGTVGDANARWKLMGEIENTGKLLVGQFSPQEDFVLTGGGELRFSASTFFSGSTNWINEDNVIGGRGTAVAPATNRGTIQADESGATLTLGTGLAMSNPGLLQAINGGRLTIGGNIVNYEGTEFGTIHSANNSPVTVGSLTGGIVTTAGTGSVSVTQLADVHNQGTLLLMTSNGTASTLAGDLRNDGTLKTSTGGVTISRTVSQLSGTGTWTGNQNAPIRLNIGTTNPTIFVQEVGHTIRGRLDIRIVNGSFRNRGTLIAEGTSRIRIEQGTMTQEGTLSVPIRLEVETRDQQFTNNGITNATGDIVVYRSVTGPLDFVNAPDATINLRGAIRLDVLDRSNDFTVLWNQERATFAGKGSIDLIETNGTHAALFRNSGLIRPEGDTSRFGRLSLDSDLQQDATGRLEIDLGGILSTEFDALVLAGTDAVLGGSLDVALVPTFDPAIGDSFTLIDTAGGTVSGTFESFTAPALAGRWWQLNYLADKVVLNVAAITADFDGNGFVDGDDLDDWQLASQTATSTADADGDGDSDGRDFLAWQRQYGSGINPLATSVAVPEPAGLVLVILASGLFAFSPGLRLRLFV